VGWWVSFDEQLRGRSKIFSTHHKEKKEKSGMPLSQERLISIECFTMDLLRESYGESKYILPPIDLNKLVNIAGLKIMAKETHHPDFAGIYDRQKGLIIVKKSDPLFHKVFTVAHELGHYYLHTDKPSEIFYRHHQHLLEAYPEEDQECEANWFAASLLTPKRIFILFWRFIQNIDALAECFGISSTVCYYRLKHLGMV
jgi:Zn-dependent peptidase ImmA (M78 family)